MQIKSVSIFGGCLLLGKRLDIDDRAPAVLHLVDSRGGSGYRLGAIAF